MKKILITALALSLLPASSALAMEGEKGKEKKGNHIDGRGRKRSDKQETTLLLGDHTTGTLSNPSTSAAAKKSSTVPTVNLAQMQLQPYEQVSERASKLLEGLDLATEPSRVGSHPDNHSSEQIQARGLWQITRYARLIGERCNDTAQGLAFAAALANTQPKVIKTVWEQTQGPKPDMKPSQFSELSGLLREIQTSVHELSEQQMVTIEPIAANLPATETHVSPPSSQRSLPSGVTDALHAKLDTVTTHVQRAADNSALMAILERIEQSSGANLHALKTGDEATRDTIAKLQADVTAMHRELTSMNTIDVVEEGEASGSSAKAPSIATMLVGSVNMLNTQGEVLQSILELLQETRTTQQANTPETSLSSANSSATASAHSTATAQSSSSAATTSTDKQADTGKKDEKSGPTVLQGYKGRTVAVSYALGLATTLAVQKAFPYLMKLLKKAPVTE